MTTGTASLTPFHLWNHAAGEVIEAIGQPADHGHHTPEGEALDRIVNIGDELVWGGDFDQSQMAAIIIDSTEALGRIKWPREYKARMPRFEKAFAELKQCTDVLRRALLNREQVA